MEIRKWIRGWRAGKGRIHCLVRVDDRVQSRFEDEWRDRRRGEMMAWWIGKWDLKSKERWFCGSWHVRVRRQRHTSGRFVVKAEASQEEPFHYRTFELQLYSHSTSFTVLARSKSIDSICGASLPVSTQFTFIPAILFSIRSGLGLLPTPFAYLRCVLTFGGCQCFIFRICFVVPANPRLCFDCWKLVRMGHRTLFIYTFGDEKSGSEFICCCAHIWVRLLLFIVKIIFVVWTLSLVFSYDGLRRAGLWSGLHNRESSLKLL